MIAQRTCKHLRVEERRFSHTSDGYYKIRIFSLIIFAFALILAVDSAAPPSASAVDGWVEDYVFVTSVKGKVTRQIVGEGRPSYANVELFEVLYPGTVLKIDKGAFLALGCAGCTEMSLTDKNSPYIIQMKDFRPEGSLISEKILKHISAALKSLIYPDSELGDLIHPRVRGPKTILQPQGLVVPITKEIIFIWTPETMRAPTTIKVVDSGKKTIVYIKEMITTNRVHVSADRFEAGKKYEWSVMDFGGVTYNEIFTLVPSNEKERILTIMKELDETIPAGVEHTDRYRIQAGFLNSENYIYDAHLWMEIHRGENR